MDIFLEKIHYNGMNIFCIKNDNCITPVIRSGEIWEGWMEKFIKHFYIPNTDMLDIGANIGITTFQQLMKYKSEKNIIYMFEPYFGDIIEKTINENKINSHVKLYKYALSNENKKIDIKLPNLNNATNYGGFHINNNSILKEGDNNCFALDHFNLKNISLIKIDVENHEFLALQGMKETLIHNHPTILIEQWSKSRGWIYTKMKNDSIFCQKLMLNYLDVSYYLKELGYICYHILGDDYLYVHKSKKHLLSSFINHVL